MILCFKFQSRNCHSSMEALPARLQSSANDGPDVLTELRQRLASGPADSEEEYTITSRAPPKPHGSTNTGMAEATSATLRIKRPVFTLRTRLKLRQEAELSSPLSGSGEVRAGTHVHILQTRVLPEGTERACISLSGHDEMLGWVSMYLDGQQNLIGEAEAFAAHMASLTAAIEGKNVEDSNYLETAAPNSLSDMHTGNPTLDVTSRVKKKKKALPKFGGGGETCHACKKTAYQAERVQVASYFFHLDCVRCSDCGQRLNSNYSIAINNEGVDCLYCPIHAPAHRSEESAADRIKDEETSKPTDRQMFNLPVAATQSTAATATTVAATAGTVAAAAAAAAATTTVPATSSQRASLDVVKLPSSHANAASFSSEAAAPTKESRFGGTCPPMARGAEQASWAFSLLAMLGFIGRAPCLAQLAELWQTRG